MRTARSLIRHVPLALPTIFAALLAAGTPAAAADDSKDALFPGARLVQKFPKEVYRIPAFVPTDKEPRLEIWIDAFDPEPPPKIGQIPGTVLPDPRVEMLIWDPLANKELHKLSYPKDPIAFPRTASNGGGGGGTALSPDGKRLASVTYNYKPPKQGVVYGDWATQIKLIDVESQKAEAVAEYKDEKVGSAPTVTVWFGRNGDVMTIRGTTFAAQEPGKDKPRATFEVTRAAKYKTEWWWCQVHSVAVSPDGSQLAIAADGAIIVYDTATGKKLFEAARAAPEPKKGGEPFPAAVSLAYAPSAKDPKLLAVEAIKEFPPGGLGAQDAKKGFVLARVFDLKAMKEVSKWKLADHTGDVSAYYTPKDEPRILCDGRVIDGASGKELYKFDPGYNSFVSPDGKALVRMTKKKKEDRTMTFEVWSLENDK
jgi:hypothetical protein